MSAKEEELLRKYLISRKADRLSERSAPSLPKQSKRGDVEENYNIATVRIASRLFISTYSMMKLWDLLMRRYSRRNIE